MLTKADIQEGLKHRLRNRTDEIDELLINKVVIDSREADQGSVFFALRGERDGHTFVNDAIRGGARAVVVEKEPETESTIESAAVFVVDNTLAALQDLAKYWRRKHSIKVIGVTGSVGKTTTKELIAEVLKTRFKVLKSEKNLNNEIGLPLTLLKLNGVYNRAVLEMGMYDVGEISLLCDIAQPETGVVTNIGHSHFARLGSLEKIAEAKRELIECLPDHGFAILNGDDDLVASFKSLTQARTITYGLEPNCDIRADQVESGGLEGIRFWLHYAGESLQVKLPLLGSHSVHSALAAAAVGISEGLSWEEILTGLRKVSVQLRLLVLQGVNGSTIIDDCYNASPASTLAALNLLAEMDGRKVAVLGDMLELGTYEEIGHRKVGIRAAEVAHKLVTVGARGRIIGEAARSAGLKDVEMVSTNDEAAAILLDVLKAEDSVLIKGSRGMKMEEIVERIQAE